MRGPPVVLTNTLGRPVTNIISERGAVPMTVVNTLGEPVTLVNSGGEPVTLFNPNGTLWDYPFSLFSNNEQGAWYDPSDFSTLYQTSTGTTPVTAVEQPVGLMLDRSRGLVLGAELVTNGDFSSATGWTVPAAWAISGGAARVTVAAAPTNVLRSSLSAGAWYLVTIVVSEVTAGSVRAFVGSSSYTPFYTTPGTYSAILQANSNGNIGLENNASFVGAVDSISARELPGNHALQATSASRPVLRARYNLLTFSEQFDNAAWAKQDTTITANAGVAPDGTTTADKLIEAATTAIHYAAITTNRTGTFTYSIYAKAAERTLVAIAKASNSNAVRFNLSTGVITSTGGDWSNASIEALANGWYRCAATVTLSSDWIYTSPNTAASYTGDGASGILIWGAQLLTAADQTSTAGAYQRVGAATDYDTSNPVWRPYLAFDGTDDSFGTSSIDFSATDEMTVFAGVTKLSDAATALLAELSASVTANNGSFYLAAPGSNGATDVVFIPKGTTAASVTASGITAPSTSVVTGLSDISAPVSTIRINGAQSAQNTSTQGTGNFGNHPLFIGARNNASFRFNGRLYSLAVLGRTATAEELTAMETWVNGKTGAY
jgi:hypothetical protein